MEYFLFFLVVLAALLVSGLFVWGVFQLFRLPARRRKVRVQARKDLTLKRHDENPILHPGKYDFEKEAVMNPAAVDDGEQTHLFYRAIGSDGVSRIGYASSADGTHIDERLPYPVFALEGPDPHLAALRRAYAEANYPALIASGGSWGGCEDPRAVIIGDRVYVSFSAFHNWDSVRIGMISISLDDLKNKRWNWSRPTFLSPDKEVHKNWLLFPEKIAGKFAILHSISPKVEIEQRENLEAIGRTEPYVHSENRPRVDIVNAVSGFWHSRMRGAGAPPVKTPFGWLLFYHGMEAGQMDRYKVGAMLLDHDDPTKIIARSPVPVLEPETHYELGGAKPGVVYASGATVKGDTLTVYYGAADNFVCAARASLSDFVMKLFEHKPAKLAPVPISV